jgi:hypothetical protein
MREDREKTGGEYRVIEREYKVEREEKRSKEERVEVGRTK